MVGKSLNEFIETLCYGGEMDFIYKGREFLIQGITEDEEYIITIDEYTKQDVVNNKKLFSKTVKGCSFESCAKKLLAGSFIDDKSLYEIEEEIEVLFG